MISPSLKSWPRAFRLRPRQRLSPPKTFVSFARPISTSAAIRMSKFEEELAGNEKSEYLPVHAGTIIEGDGGETFEAVRKLGWGANSSVWVGRNCSEEASPKYFALKILNKSATREHEDSSGMSSNELNMLVRARVGKEPEHRPQVPIFIEQGLSGPPHEGWFHIYGCQGAFACDNGQHLVIVSPLYGENMRDYMLGEPKGRLQQTLVKRVARQTLIALDYLHSMCGITHCDVKAENILRDFNAGVNVDEIFEDLLKVEPNAGREGRSAPLWLPHNDRYDDFEFSVVLSDFSHSTWSDLIQRSPRAIGSPAIKAPELVMAKLYNTKIDIWSFGCTVFELLTGKLLFGFPDSESRSPNDLAKEPKYHLSLMQSLVREPFPDWASRGTITVEEGFIGTGRWIGSLEIGVGDTLDERIAKDVPQDVKDKDKFAAFLRRCLKLDPNERATAPELLKDEWLSEI